MAPAASSTGRAAGLRWLGPAGALDRQGPCDEDGDGFFDRFYAVDIKGRVFVYSFPEKIKEGADSDTVNSLIVNTLAALGARDSNGKSGISSEKARLFYESPGLTVGHDAGGAHSVLAIGSGWRANPQSEKSDDGIFILKDRSGGVVDSPIRESDLTQLGFAPLNISNQSNSLLMKLSPKGEKVFGSPLIIDGKVFFTTYTPTSGAEACQLKGGVALYGIDLATGLGLFNRSRTLAAPNVDNDYALRNLSVSSLGDVQGVMLGNNIQLLSGGRVFGSLEQPINLVHPLSWHEVARGKDVHNLFPVVTEQ